MDSLIASFLTLILAETGDRTQLLAAALAIRFASNRPVLMGLAAASLINCLLSAYAGSFIGQWVSQDPVRLFNGLAYVMAGVAMLAWRREVDLLKGWKTGPFLTAFFGIFILQFGDKGQFIIGAHAARADHWLFPAIGGWLGILAAVLPAILMNERLVKLLPIAKIRAFGGVVFCLLGLIHALRAWHII